jgi:hypothetical protein
VRNARECGSRIAFDDSDDPCRGSRVCSRQLWPPALRAAIT